MAKLVFLLDGHAVKEHVLDKARISIGRRASNDICLDNAAVSGKHAVVLTVAGDRYIEDLNSTNGMVVNKVKVEKHLFVDGDVVGLGKYQVRYLLDDDFDVLSSNELENTVFDAEAIEPHEGQTDQAGLQQERELNSVKPIKSAYLTILDGDDVGSKLLLDKAIVKIGQPNVQLAVITKRIQGYFISHVMGNNDLLLNGQPINANVRVLSHRDKVEMLGVKMEFSFDSSDAL